MTDLELLSLNNRGFIPGPRETEREFLARICAIQSRFNQQKSIPPPHWDWVRHHLEELFDFSPESLVAFYSNANLTPWQAAACWIDPEKVPELQLRETFRKGHFLFLYSREEILAHESIHAARSAFDEPENEEFFAYAASEKKWRRILSPIIQRPWEVWVLLVLFLASFFSEFAYFGTALWACLGAVRLARQHIRRARAASNLKNLGKDHKTCRAILLRLTDAEIRALSKGKKITDDFTLRWRLLRLAYFL